MHDRWHGSAGGSLGAGQDLRQDGPQTAVPTHRRHSTACWCTCRSPVGAHAKHMPLCWPVLTDDDHEDEHGLDKINLL